MERDAQIEKRIREMKIALLIGYIEEVKDKFRDQTEVYHSFLNILREHTQRRIDINGVYMRVSELFGAHPELIESFRLYFGQSVFIKDDVEDESMETLGPAEKAKMEDGSNKPISEFDPTSSATTSYSFHYSHATHSSCASGSSSHSCPENATEPHHAQNEKAAQLIEGTAYVTQMKRMFMDGFQAHQHFTELIKEISANRIDINDVLMRVSELFGAHPELIETFRLYFRQSVFIKDGVENESMETLGPAKKGKMEDDITKPISEFDPTSSATTSYSSNYSHATHSSCASGSSSHSCPENATEPRHAQNQKAAQLREGTVYVTDMKHKLMDGFQVYQHFTELIKETCTNRVNIHDLMEHASKLLQGYPELIEYFHRFLLMDPELKFFK